MIMKKTLTILVMALAVIVGAQTTNAQSLLNKAKKAGKALLEGKSPTTVAQEVKNDVILEQEIAKHQKKQLEERHALREADEKRQQAEDGQTGVLPEANESAGDVDFLFKSGRRMGIYHSKTKTFDRFGRKDGKWIIWYQMKFRDDGWVVDGNDQGLGKINSDGSMYSATTTDIKVNDKGHVLWKGQDVGYISNLGDVYFCDDFMAYSQLPVDKNITAFVTFCMNIDNDYIAKYKPQYDEIRAKEQAEAAATAKASAQFNVGDPEKCWMQGNQIFVAGKGTVGEFRSDGQVYYNGRQVALIKHDALGDIICKPNHEEIGLVGSNGYVSNRKTGAHMAILSDNGDISVGTKGVVKRIHRRGTKTQSAVLYIFHEQLGIKY